MLYLYPIGDSFSIFYNKDVLSPELQESLIEIEALPEGEGILRRSEGGEFYYEPFPEPTPEPTPEPKETIEEKLIRLEQIIEQNNLMSLDIQLGLYEQLMVLQIQLNGGN